MPTPQNCSCAPAGSTQGTATCSAPAHPEQAAPCSAALTRSAVAASPWGGLVFLPQDHGFASPSGAVKTQLGLRCIADEEHHTFPPATQTARGGRRVEGSQMCPRHLLALTSGHSLQIPYNALGRREVSPCQAATVIFSLEINSLYNQQYKKSVSSQGISFCRHT